MLECTVKPIIGKKLSWFESLLRPPPFQGIKVHHPYMYATFIHKCTSNVQKTIILDQYIYLYTLLFCLSVYIQ